MRVQENITIMAMTEDLGGSQTLSCGRKKMGDDIYYSIFIIICMTKAKQFQLSFS